MIFTACEDNNDNDGATSSNPLATLTCAPNEILYTTKYGLPIELSNTQGFGGNLIYNIYEEGIGRLVFDYDIVTIPDEAFNGCKSIKYVKYPNSVASIGNAAFYNCISLASVTILNSVTSIGEYAFRGCNNLTSIYCKSTTPPSGSSYMFNVNSSYRKIYVPTASVNAYKSAQYWSSYASNIVGYDF